MENFTRTLENTKNESKRKLKTETQLNFNG